ncbi:hypothetical protein SDC9_185388 [bioreactor metagenome]|uniref:Uncharacterized protein n=1 Tax=bioreactor metagenome TaxID=1076179 RepID=A0A645HFQ7_9ZZZZ
MLIDLVGQDHDVGAAQQIGQPVEIGPGQQAAGRIMRRIEHDHPRLRRDQGRHLLPVGRVVGKFQLRMDRLAANGFNRRHIAVIDRLEDDHLVAGPDEGGDSGEDGLRRPRRHRDLGLDIETRAVQGSHLVDDGLAQLRQTAHRRVLVASGEHVAMHRIE